MSGYEDIEALVEKAISNKHIFLPKVKFVGVVRTKLRPICTIKHFEEGLVMSFFEEVLKRSFHGKNSRRHSIYKETRFEESITLVGE